MIVGDCSDCSDCSEKSEMRLKQILLIVVRNQKLKQILLLALIVSWLRQTDRQTDRPTMSLIELSWTAKKQISIKLTFLHGLGLISKLALNCLLCAAVNIVRGRLGPLVLSWLYTL